MCGWRIAALLLVCAPLLGTRCEDGQRRPFRPASARPPNVVLLVADDLGWKDVGYHGGVVATPHIDRLAADGIRLERFYAAPVCTPTRAALLTGRSPIHFGLQYTVVRQWSTAGLPDREYTLAERFRDAGYQTAIVGKWHLGHARSEFHPNLQGFDHFYGSLYGEVDYFSHDSPYGHDLQQNGTPIFPRGYLTTLTGVEAARYVRERDRGRPFFLYVPFHAPHRPTQAPAEAVARYASLPGLERRTHAAMVDVLDQEIGRILEALERERIARETIVVFLSDNGGAPAAGGINAPLRGGKADVYEGGVRVPAVVRWTGRLPPGESHQMLRDHDLFATLEAAAGLPLRAPPESLNAFPVLRGAPLQRREPFFFAVDGRDRLLLRAVISEGWKLVARDNIRIATRLGVFSVSTRDLFDIESDPEERRSRAAEFPERVAALEEELRRWEANHPPEGLRFEERPRSWWPRSDLTLYLADPGALAAELDARRRQGSAPPVRATLARRSRAPTGLRELPARGLPIERLNPVPPAGRGARAGRIS